MRPSRRRPHPRFSRLLLALLLPVLAGLCARASELGRPLIRTFTRQEHKAHAQFHAPFQSAEGPMYFGNQLAVMEYDGRTWRVLKIPLPFTRAMAAGPRGDLYVGDEEALGVLAAPDSGEPGYTSLLERVPADAKPFGFVRDVRVWRGDVYFATDKNLLRYREAEGRFRVWPLGGAGANRLFLAQQRLILHRPGEGLFEFDGERLQRLGDAPELARAASVVVLPGSAPQELLVALPEGGLFQLGADRHLTRWPTDTDATLQRTTVLAAIRLHDGAIALGTVNEGLILLDAQGRLLRHLTRESGLPQATVFALCEDRERGLWVSTNNGPARVLWRSAATVFDHQNSGLTDARAMDITRHDGMLYYLSNDGLYRLVPSADPRVPAKFQRDPRVDVQARLSSLLSHRAGLLLASSRGLQRLGAKGLEVLPTRAEGLAGLSASATDPARVFFAHTRGVSTGTFGAEGEWHDEGELPGIAAECFDVIEESDGTLWVGSISKGVFRATRAAGADNWRDATVTHFTTEHGLPEGHGSIYLWRTALGVLFDTARGIYRFDRATQRFVFYGELTAFDPRPLVLNPVVAGAPRELWTNGLSTDVKTKEVPYPLLRLRARGDGRFAAESPPPEIQDFFSPGAPYRIFWEADGGDGAPVLWAKGDQGLLRIELARYKPLAFTVAPLVRLVEAEGRELRFPRAGPGELRLQYSREPMTIAWVSGLFRRSESERFQTRLVGFNDTWSAPTARNDIAFTNLEGGPFRFEVRNVDRQGNAGPAAGFTFFVAPPWPRTTTAYFIYGLLGLGGVAGFVRWRLRAGERERARLERIVALRTAELRVAKDLADDANRAKSVFLANMSHELRTPLNGVIGYAQVLMKDPELSPKNRERLRVVQTSGEHLLRMINEVLDFSKIEAGKMELATAPFHLPQLLRDVAAALSPRMQQKALEFVFDPAPELPDIVLGDAVKLRQVLDNLLGNAVKFTAAGSVRLEVRLAGDERVLFSVSDTGVGITEADRAKLFQPFQQAADGRPPEPGTGLGLAISQRMVELMGGELAVETRPGHGSRFFFTLALPVLATDASAPRSTASLITGYQGRRRRLLVVDDIATNRDVLRDLLAPLGFEIETAASGTEALAALAAAAPDLVFLDLRMPGIDGLELTRRIRQRTGGAAIKIIAMSASVLSFNRGDALAAGCDDFLPKPFREDDLLARLGLALQLEWVGDLSGETEHGRGLAARAAARAATADSAAPFQVTSTLAGEELRELLAIAQRGEITALRARLEMCRRDPLVDALTALARNYRMERIREVLETRLGAAVPERKRP